jgi:CubicO group peptidase (beta-lactamase class C family)
MATLLRFLFALLAGLAVQDGLADARHRTQVQAVAIDAALKPLFPPNEPGGAIIIVKAGKTVFWKGYGLANIERRTPQSPVGPFRYHGKVI